MSALFIRFYRHVIPEVRHDTVTSEYERMVDFYKEEMGIDLDPYSVDEEDLKKLHEFHMMVTCLNTDLAGRFPGLTINGGITANTLSTHVYVYIDWG